MSAPPERAERPISPAQQKKLHAALNAAGVTDRAGKLQRLSEVLGRDVTTSGDLTFREASQVINALRPAPEAGPADPATAGATPGPAVAGTTPPGGTRRGSAPAAGDAPTVGTVQGKPVPAAGIRKVLGVDPSLTATGLATAYPGGELVAEVEGRKGKLGEDLATRAARLSTLVLHVAEHVGVWRGPAPVLVVIEGPSHGSRGGSAWDRAGLWWGIVNACLGKGALVAVCSPSTRAQWATGKGNADKAAVAARVAKLTDADLPSADHADAAALALIGAHRLGWRPTCTPPTAPPLWLPCSGPPICSARRWPRDRSGA